MGKPTREHIALAVFMACVILIGAGIGAYLVAGHSWNYAASRIDDAAGEMEGYRVVVYEGVAVPVRTRVDDRGHLLAAPASAKAVAASYRAKGATVLRLDVQHPSRYAEPAVFEKDGYRVGVLSVEPAEEPIPVQRKVDYLISHGVDTVIAIVPAAETVAKAYGIDVIIDLGERSALETGSSAADGYHIAMPAVGTVGAIVISPSEVVSARTISG